MQLWTIQHCSYWLHLKKRAQFLNTECHHHKISSVLSATLVCLVWPSQAHYQGSIVAKKSFKIGVAALGRRIWNQIQHVYSTISAFKLVWHTFLVLLSSPILCSIFCDSLYSIVTMWARSSLSQECNSVPSLLWTFKLVGDLVYGLTKPQKKPI